jgi:hypothetical protein
MTAFEGTEKIHSQQHTRRNERQLRHRQTGQRYRQEQVRGDEGLESRRATRRGVWGAARAESELTAEGRRGRGGRRARFGCEEAALSVALLARIRSDGYDCLSEHSTCFPVARAQSYLPLVLKPSEKILILSVFLSI